ncbi:putative interferon-induced gtp-binding protein mx1 protein [Neofusicoccum parvum]|uniref:Interferon-induced gtp-binding protein mx1 protein n=1 Tax=Neofusicoccum parvum TaxID=310453 RepID=A0ACB5RTU9_9PEZI|nr:putative interferon-induced gtp-binding protein mx1 protein [Neofusicoccum parvum]
MSASSSSMADPAMLKKIDKLFACNVGHYVDLPQIVVVGDQSSGKSSVLEGLTRLPFPRDSGLCTRFATQITFRRSEDKYVSVCIIPRNNASQEHSDTIRAWKKHNLSQLDQESFTTIITEVHSIMGISNQANQQDSTAVSASKTFAEDVLSIEVGGPEEEHLTVIDVPGIFRLANHGVTTKADIALVEQMVLGYMKNPRSVMLAVIPANVDIATQAILQMAEELDPEGQRTLGVLTKPDLVDKGAEKMVMEMVDGDRHPLRLGWSLLRNPGQAEAAGPNSDRNAIERAFFELNAPWSSLPKDRVGIDALRAKLQEILAAHIRREFPKVKAEVNKRLKECAKALENLGPKRDTVAKQSKFLIDMGMRFQAMASHALDANYGVDDAFAEHSALKIATRVVSRNEKLAGDFARYGHTYLFDEHDEDGANKLELPAPKTAQYYASSKKKPRKGLEAQIWASLDNEHFDTAPAPPTEEEPALNHEVPEAVCEVRVITASEDIDDMLHENERIHAPKPSGITRWLTETYQHSRGFELASFNPRLVSTAMKEQSRNWDALSLGYISDVVAITHSFITTLLQLICPDRRVRENLHSILEDHLNERYRKAFDQVRFILQVERSGAPATMNHYFVDNLEKCRQERMRKAAALKSISDYQHGTVVRLSDLTQTHKDTSNQEHLIQDLHDILKSYYKVARKRIVDTLCMHATAYHLISGPDTPLRLFSPTFVSDLSGEQLEEIAGEEAVLKRRRTQLLKELEDLEMGRRILS